MKYLYLDHNIYIETIDNLRLRKYLEDLSGKKLQCLYSPAHIEEIFKVVSNETSQYKNKMDLLIEAISKITNNKQILPTSSELIIENEHPNTCYSRVSGLDTRKRVENDSKTKFVVDTDNYKELLSINKQNLSISNIEPNKIWEFPAVKELIEDLNKNIPTIIDKYNHSIEVQMLNLLGVDKTLPTNFCFKLGNYPLLKNSHKQLEYTIEVLFRLLNYVGYCAEKSERTAISGTHDVSHSIYGTKADYLLSLDKRFVKKCQAVYNFLGVDTAVIYCKQEELENTIEKLV